MNKSNSIIILGGGMVGSAIARDLQEFGYDVTVADWSDKVQANLEPHGIRFIKIDLLNKDLVSQTIEYFNLVIGAVPGFMGYEILKTVIEARKNIVDISFMPEDCTDFNNLAKKKGVTVIADAGVAPGLSNLMFGKALSDFDTLHSAKCYVGGLPQSPQPPWLYKSVFSPIDVIEEYTRPARIVQDGEMVIRPAMTDIEQIEFEGIGKLDAFNSDGLRSLLDLPIANMVEKTLRYPGHIQQIIEMRDDGLFEPDKIELTSKELINDWTPLENDFDQTIMRLEFSGIRNGNKIIETLDLFDRYDEDKKISSMARTTGFTCSAVAHMLLSGSFNKSGVFNLESFGDQPEAIDRILGYLSDRNIQI